MRVFGAKVVADGTLFECAYTVLLELLSDNGVEEGIGTRVKRIEDDHDNFSYEEAAHVS